jgi:hypothetical protein
VCSSGAMAPTARNPLPFDVTCQPELRLGGPRRSLTGFAMSAKVVKNESSLALARRDQRAYGP